MAKSSYIVRKLHWLPLVNLPVMFPLTLRHYYPFGSFRALLKNGELASPESWDAIRSSSHPNFVISDERTEWLKGLSDVKDGQDLALQQRVDDIASLFIARDVKSVHSVGVGGGALEYFTKRALPHVCMIASDYNPEGVARLRRVFTECDQVERFDIATDDWSLFPSAVVLMCRVDPHLSDPEWRAVFERLAASGIEKVLYIPSNEISFQYLAFCWLRSALAKLRGDQVAFAGYVRSARVFPALWQGFYSHETMRLGGLNSYWLSLKSQT